MRNHINLILYFRLLHQLPVRTHPLFCERARELVADEGGGVQAGEGDELPAVAEFAEAVDVGFLFGAGHGGFPVEGGGEVVGESGEVILVS